MSVNETKLGGGYASGMFYHAPAGTTLPAYPGETLDPAWVHVGDVTEDGISWATGRSYTPLKSWALEIKRMLPSTDPQTIKVPIMDTTEEVFKTIFGASNVTVTPANGSHGEVITVDTSSLNTPTEEAFLFIMKDGDVMSYLGTTSGFISALDDVAFKATEGITWNATISSSAWAYVQDDGQIEES